ncbi:hypothetical protein [Siphonobacter sp. SORGH_AS_1065]|uniref:hypothetical protein n=1 Tax=Siphonobacter sp. SORGH_AS_1065 TaxID=3041795 RepID=UPI00277EECDD|nr:hypothetical protein [Siphonobacter sp. SORGH_AS_1065]MDQ1090189.1 hypothetical protein [Siphonobacter sp. SORGH_AS_1065]
MNVHTITEQVFKTWTSDWKTLETEIDHFSFFANETSIQTGVVLNQKTLEYLLSTPGTSTIKIRFGFSKEEENFFQVILWGTDELEQRITPYYHAKDPIFEKRPDQSNGGQVPAELQKQWRFYWLTKANDNLISACNFQVPHGFLKGYNYELEEFMEALLIDRKATDVRINFGLHEHLNASYQEGDPAIYTFGLLLRAETDIQQTGDDDDDDGYFDLVSPCPPTCK